jgi:hypothetical protein
MRATLSALLRQRHVDEPPIFYLEESAQWAALALALEAPPAGLFCSPGPSVAAAATTVGYARRGRLIPGRGLKPPQSQ